MRQNAVARVLKHNNPQCIDGYARAGGGENTAGVGRRHEFPRPQLRRLQPYNITIKNVEECIKLVITQLYAAKLRIVLIAVPFVGWGGDVEHYVFVPGDARGWLVL